jgi:hypothetical protein
MKQTTWIVATLLAFAARNVSAQTLENFKQQLSTPIGSGQVEIVEEPGATNALRTASRALTERRHEGWRITLFVSNSSHARSEAYETVRNFESNFPGLDVAMSYDNPYFKVSACHCATAEEAIILLERILVHFPKAFLSRENMSATDFIERRASAIGTSEGEPLTTDEE